MLTALIPSCPGFRAIEDGRIQKQVGDLWATLPQNVNKRTGYVTVSINQAPRNVHRLVLEAFVGPCPDGMECRHFPDSNKRNNSITNLSWGTHEQNIHDQESNLPENKVVTVIMFRRSKAKDVASMLNISIDTVRRIWRGEIYKSIIRKYFLDSPSKKVRNWFVNGLVMACLIMVGCSKPVEPTSESTPVPSAISKLTDDELKTRAKTAFDKFEKSCNDFDRARDKRDRKMIAELIIIQMRHLDEIIDEGEKRARATGKDDVVRRIRDARDSLKVMKKRLEDETTNSDSSR